MRFTPVLLAAVGAIIAGSYTIDPNLEDGIYFIPLLTNSSKFRRSEPIYGEPIRIADAVYPKTLSERSVVGVVPVPADSNSCYQATESRSDLDGAKNSLSTVCGRGVKIRQWYEVSGLLLARYASSLAFACSWGGKQGCAPNEIDNAWSQITNNCDGDLKSGHICASSWKKCYGHSTVTSQICDNTV
ncbi:hypothetical protein NUW58_g3477 [Xylaria curta]|uniref:Uncharacterized protein n=1 Tax=Xylaria curta TaxID=42375 RepID=A0ACC1PAS2_9PEZI|nr:hypothetical protein NUW58_g3477 [Xylaria curta]